MTWMACLPRTTGGCAQEEQWQRQRRSSCTMGWLVEGYCFLVVNDMMYPPYHVLFSTQHIRYRYNYMCSVQCQA